MSETTQVSLLKINEHQHMVWGDAVMLIDVFLLLWMFLVSIISLVSALEHTSNQWFKKIVRIAKTSVGLIVWDVQDSTYAVLCKSLGAPM